MNTANHAITRNVTLRFQNIPTRETREIAVNLHEYYCPFDNEMCYQLFLPDGTPAAEYDNTPNGAIRNGTECEIPYKQWGWSDVWRCGAVAITEA